MSHKNHKWKKYSPFLPKKLSRPLAPEIPSAQAEHSCSFISNTHVESQAQITTTATSLPENAVTHKLTLNAYSGQPLLIGSVTVTLTLICEQRISVPHKRKFRLAHTTPPRIST
jgi:hypothetical protein